MATEISKRFSQERKISDGAEELPSTLNKPSLLSRLLRRKDPVSSSNRLKIIATGARGKGHPDEMVVNRSTHIFDDHEAGKRTLAESEAVLKSNIERRRYGNLPK